MMMKRKEQFATVFLVSLLCVVPCFKRSGFAQSYLVIDLGTPDNSGSYSDPHGLNQSGAVVGEWEPTNSIWQHAFWYHDGTNGDVSGLDAGGGIYAIAHGINNSNLIVGEYGIAAIHAFVSSNGTTTDLGTLGGTYSVAWALNSSGDVVGESTTGFLMNSPVHAVWYHGGAKTDLGTLTNGDYSSAFGINDAGTIVGESSAISGGVTNTYGFIYSNGAIAALPTLGGNYGSAHAINSAGQIVGESSVAGGEAHAFRYTGGGMTDLGTFGGSFSTGSALNSAGTVVGYALTGTGDAHAFLYYNSTLLDLNTLISPSLVCTNLISADGINDQGVITGSGYTSTGDYHAFLLLPTLHLATPAVWPDGHFTVDVQGLPGQRFVFQAASNLVDWVSLGTNTLTTSSLTCTDSFANSPSRFYRAELLP